MGIASRPEASSSSVSRRMSRQRRTDTKPEMKVRVILHAAGLRYRVNAVLPGLSRRRADMLFTRARLAIFIDGCFWHSCPVHATAPRANADWWTAKLAGNVARDRATEAHLSSLGWTVLRFWEHESPYEVAERIIDAYRAAQAAPPIRANKH